MKFRWIFFPILLLIGLLGYFAWWLVLRHYGEERPSILFFVDKDAEEANEAARNARG